MAESEDSVKVESGSTEVEVSLEKQVEISNDNAPTPITVPDCTDSPSAIINGEKQEEQVEENNATLAAGENDASFAAEENVPVAAEENVPVAAEENVHVAAEENVPVAADENVPVAAEENVPVAAEESNAVVPQEAEIAEVPSSVPKISEVPALESNAEDIRSEEEEEEDGGSLVLDDFLDSLDVLDSWNPEEDELEDIGDDEVDNEVDNDKVSEEQPPLSPIKEKKPTDDRYRRDRSRERSKRYRKDVGEKRNFRKRSIHRERSGDGSDPVAAKVSRRRSVHRESSLERAPQRPRYLADSFKDVKDLRELLPVRKESRDSRDARDYSDRYRDKQRDRDSRTYYRARDRERDCHREKERDREKEKEKPKEKLEKPPVEKVEKIKEEIEVKPPPGVVPIPRMKLPSDDLVPPGTEDEFWPKEEDEEYKMEPPSIIKIKSEELTPGDDKDGSPAETASGVAADSVPAEGELSSTEAVPAGEAVEGTAEGDGKEDRVEVQKATTSSSREKQHEGGGQGKRGKGESRETESHITTVITSRNPRERNQIFNEEIRRTRAKKIQREIHRERVQRRDVPASHRSARDRGRDRDKDARLSLSPPLRGPGAPRRRPLTRSQSRSRSPRSRSRSRSPRGRRHYPPPGGSSPLTKRFSRRTRSRSRERGGKRFDDYHHRPRRSVDRSRKRSPLRDGGAGGGGGGIGGGESGGGSRPSAPPPSHRQSANREASPYLYERFSSPSLSFELSPVSSERERGGGGGGRSPFSRSPSPRERRVESRGERERERDSRRRGGHHRRRSPSFSESSLSLSPEPYPEHLRPRKRIPFIKELERMFGVGLDNFMASSTTTTTTMPPANQYISNPQRGPPMVRCPPVQDDGYSRTVHRLSIREDGTSLEAPPPPVISADKLYETSTKKFSKILESNLKGEGPSGTRPRGQRGGPPLPEIFAGASTRGGRSGTAKSARATPRTVWKNPPIPGTVAVSRFV